MKFTTDWDTLSDTDLEGKKYETSIEYDGLNRPRRIKNPEDQDSERKETIPTYNRADALQKLNFNGEDYVKEVAYNAKGQKIMTASAAVFTRYTYDTETFRLLRIRNSKYTKVGNTWTPQSGIRIDRGYAYDLMGSVVKEYNYTPKNVWAQGSGDLIRQFTHDPMRRLLSGTGRESTNRLKQPTWDLNYSPSNYQLSNIYTRSYEYDKIGNIQSLKHIAHGASSRNFTRNYAYESPFDNNQLKTMSIGTNDYAYVYDANGNLVQENAERHYEWNHADKLTFFKNQVGTSDPTIWSHYFYDGEGNRIKKVVNTGTGKQTVTVYIDGVYEHSYTKNNGTIDSTRHYNTLKVMDPSTGSGQVGNSFVATLHVGNDADDTINIDKKFYTADHLGNIVATYQEDSTLINFEDYYPFGETSFGGYAKKRYRYNGKEKDSDTGLYEYGQRYYAPWLCRFVSVDPIAEDYMHLSSYNYASNRPETSIDAEGLQTPSEPKTDSGGNNQSNGLITDNSFGKLLPEVVITGTVETDKIEGKKGFIGPGINLTPAKTGEKIVQNQTKTSPKSVEPKSTIEVKHKLPINWMMLGRAASLTIGAVLTPLEAGRGSDADTYLQLPGEELEPSEQWKNHPEMSALDKLTGHRKNDPNIKWVTYTKFNPISGETYSGRSSGSKEMSALEIIQMRDAAHIDLKVAGYLDAVPDKEGVGIEGYAAIRGREQQLIDLFGGAQSDIVNFPPNGGISGNKIRGVAVRNPRGIIYDFFSTKNFGRIAPFTGKFPL